MPDVRGLTAPPAAHQQHLRPAVARRHGSSTPSTSRRQLLAALTLPPILTFSRPATAEPWDELMLAREPEQGTCPTCIGSVDGTLGSCLSTPSCLSSYDDRPDHFIAPWEFDARSQEDAMQQLKEAVRQAGATRIAQQEGSSYLYAVFEPKLGSDFLGLSMLQGTDDVEFLIPDDNDTRVEIRSASRLPNLPDGGRQKQRLESIRAALGWEQVTIMRNRRRLLVVIESPWDSFGPTPMAGQQLGGMRFEDVLANDMD